MKTRTLFASTIALTLIGSAIVINPEAARADYTTCANSDRLCLRKGDSGPIVQALVKDLRTAGYYTGANTDRFNSEVEAALQGFQTDHQHMKNDTRGYYSDLEIDGIVGKETVMRLCQKVYRGCDANISCYGGSIQLLRPCWRNYARILDFKVPAK
jgi:peptidoglycan hydrolase-like protein with peptidoglycan-binding domain